MYRKFSEDEAIDKAEKFYGLLGEMTENMEKSDWVERVGREGDSSFKIGYGISKDGSRSMEKTKYEKTPDGDFKITQTYIKTSKDLEDYEFGECMGFEYSPNIPVETFAVVKEGENRDVVFDIEESCNILLKIMREVGSDRQEGQNEQEDNGQIAE